MTTKDETAVATQDAPKEPTKKSQSKPKEEPKKVIIVRQLFINRQDLQQNPHVVYLFGDNYQRIGFGGQAAEMRGEPNGIGVVTKRNASHGRGSYFSDDKEEMDDNQKAIFQDFKRAYDLAVFGEKIAVNDIRSQFYGGSGVIVVPTDGLGTGLSQLPQRAPVTLKFINKLIEKLASTGRLA